MPIEPYGDHHPKIHPDAFVHPSAVVIGKVTIGARSSIWPCAVLRGDDGVIEIGEETSIQDGTVIHMTEGQSNTIIGNRVTVGHAVTLHGCTIGDGALVGIGAIVLDNAVVEPGAFVAAGTLVPPGKVVPAGKVAMGNPFRIVRDLAERDRAWLSFSHETYVRRAAEYKKRHGG
ncbi:MAG: gamma carbonic anhydrase family protein [Deltaproteobacteria bacterium]|nr:MAG: gamma carbonic anhydrase family protein [Deltaproteobacteria bacterium]